MSRRGRTNLPLAVVEKVAAQVASEVDDTGASAGGFLGIGGRRDFDGRPDVRAEVYGKDLVLAVRMGIRLGAPVAETARRVREHLSAKVPALTGLQVRQIDIDLTWVHNAVDVGKKVLR